jgi:inhibitor of KinA
MTARYCPNGDKMVLVEFAEEISPAVHSQVLSLASQLEFVPIGGVIEWIPSYRSLGVVYDPRQITYRELVARLQSLDISTPQVARPSLQRIEIPVCYGGAMGPDLSLVAEHHQLSPEEVVELHTTGDYRVYLLGFTPGFPYLGGMSARLATPRLAEPRLRVPAGSVAIGGNQTGIYPIESPGGWRLIGRTPLRLFDLERTPPFLLSAGDHVHFRAITPAEFHASETSSGSHSRL